MRGASWSAAIHPARRLAVRIAAAVMMVQAVVFATAGAGYLLWFESNLDAEAETRVLAPGRLIQQGQLPHAAISDRQWLQRVVGSGLVDALLVGVNGNIFHALDPANLGKQIGSIEGVEGSWFHTAGTAPTLIRDVKNGHSYIIGITPLLTYDNIAPFLYVYVKLDATIVAGEKHRMRASTIAAVLFGMLATTIVIYGVFEWLLFRRIRSAVRMLGKENDDSGGHEAVASDELGLVEIGLRKMAAERLRERSLRTEAETALVEVKAKEAASTVAAQLAEVQARRAQSLIDAVPDGLITIDQDSAVLTCNDTAARCLGRRQAEIIGRPIHAFLRPAGATVLADPAGSEDWPEVGTHRALCGEGDGEEVEIVVSIADAPDRHRVVFLRQAVDDEVRHELERLSESIGHALRLTPDQWQTVGERLAMLRAYLAGLEAERRIVSEALDAVPLAVAVVDRNGTMRYANRLAERLLDMKDGLVILHGRLTATRRRDNTQLHERILSVTANADHNGHLPWAAMRIERENGTAWFLRVAPLGRIGQQAPSAEDMVIVLISDPNMPMKPSTTMLRQLHGLTYAEADIMGRLTAGMRLAEIAAELDISVETVRTHLKSIFTKTGMSRQADLVRHAVLSGVLVQEGNGDSSSGRSPPLLAATTRRKGSGPQSQR